MTDGYKGLRTVLIVDDETIIAEDLGQRLSRMGYSVLSLAATGEEALQVARRERPSLVLMDILLRGPMDGVQAATLIAEQLELPVLFITACTDEPTLERARAVPGAAVLSKPFDDRDLELAVELVLARCDLRCARRVMAQAATENISASLLEGFGSLCTLVVDSNAVVRYVGAGAREALNISSDAVGRCGLDDFFRNPAGPTLKECVAAVVHGGATRIEVQTHPGPGGRYSWFSLTVLFHPALGTLVVGEDITERKATEQQRKALYEISEAAHGVQNLDELYRSIHRSISEVLPARNFYIAVYDEERQLLTFPYFVDELDSAPQPRPLGRGLTEYVLRKGAPVLADPARFDELAQAGEVQSIGSPSVDWLGVPLKLDGKTFGILVVQTYSEGLRYSDEDMHMLSFVSHQVAMAIDRVRKDETLRRSETQLRGLFSSMDDVVIVFNEEGRFVNVAPTNPSLLYRPAEALIGKLLHEVFPVEQADFFLDRIMSALSGGHRLQFDYPLTIDGTEHWFDSTMTPVGDGRVQLVARDITERRRMQQSLSEAQETYRSVFEHASLGISQRLLDGRFSSVNPALMRMYGYTEAEELLAEMTRRRGQLYSDPGRRTMVEGLLRTVNDVSDLESQVTRSDGTVIWISETIKLVRDAAGRPLYYITTVQDITARKQAERELRLLANTVACAQDCFLLTDLGGCILFVNDAFIATYGYSPEDLMGKSPSLLAGEGVTAATLQEAFLPVSGVWNGEMNSRRSNGTEFPAEMWTSLVRDDRGDPTAYVTVVRDISERKRTEELIRGNELRLRRITDTMLDMIVQIDTGGKCEYVSPSIRKILGYALGDMAGKNLIALVHRSDRRAVTDLFTRLYTEKTSGTVEYRLKNAHGAWVWIQSIINPLLDASGTVTGFVVGSLDITHRKLADETLRLNEARLETLVTLNQMTDASIERIIDFSIQEAVHLTRSNAGLLIFLGGENGAAAKASWSSLMQKGNDGTVRRSGTMDTLPPVLTNAIQQRQPVIVNNVHQGSLHAPAWPRDHIDLKRFMCVPILDGTQAVGVIVAGNKLEEYDLADARQLKLLMEGMWLLVQRQRSQGELRRSLEEKEILLKEVHHRVKNNLQIISSLLNLQLDHVPDPAVADILKESQNRVRSMALIHERLYRSGDLSRVDFGHYIRNLTSYLVRSYSAGPQPVHVRVEGENILLGVDVAIPCGLIVNELVTNALRHAFIDGRQGEVVVGLTQNESVCRLYVHDDGVGLPQGMAVKNAGTLGLQLVETLVDQIGGALEVQSDHGAQFNIVFKVP